MAVVLEKFGAFFLLFCKTNLDKPIRKLHLHELQSLLKNRCIRPYQSLLLNQIRYNISLLKIRRIRVNRIIQRHLYRFLISPFGKSCFRKRESEFSFLNFLFPVTFSFLESEHVHLAFIVFGIFLEDLSDFSATTD